MEIPDCIHALIDAMVRSERTNALEGCMGMSHPRYHDFTMNKTGLVSKYEPDNLLRGSNQKLRIMTHDYHRYCLPYM